MVYSYNESPFRKGINFIIAKITVKTQIRHTDAIYIALSLCVMTENSAEQILSPIYLAYKSSNLHKYCAFLRSQRHIS